MEVPPPKNLTLDKTLVGVYDVCMRECTTYVGVYYVCMRECTTYVGVYYVCMRECTTYVGAYYVCMYVGVYSDIQDM